MEEVQFKDRPYQVFVSYAHKDYPAVAKLVKWLRDFAKVKVWWDETSLPVAQPIELNIPEGIKQSRSAIIFLSKAATASGWIRKEYSAIIDQNTSNSQYSILTIKLDDTSPPDLLKTTKYIEIPDGALNEKNALDLLGSLHPSGNGSLNFSKDVYVSRSWRSNEAKPADEICRFFIRAGYRLIGDSTDRKIFDDEIRIPAIMSSCGAVLAIVPDRGNKTSPFILEEIALAKELKIPYLLVAENEKLIPDELVSFSIEGKVFNTSGIIDGIDLRNDLIDIFRENFREPIKPHYAFYGSSLIQNGLTNNYVKRLVEQVAGIECVIGAQLGSQHAQKEITRLISNCLFMLADISDDNKNTLIEAGIARGAGTTLHLLTHGLPRPTRFMFRDMEVDFYQDGVELLGIVHRIAFHYRRRVFNAELQTSDWFGA